MIRLAALVLLSSMASVDPGAGERIQTARFELRGPLTQVVFGERSSLGVHGVTRIVANLRDGELRSVVVPFDGVAGTGVPPVVSVLPPGSAGPEGRVEFVEFVDREDAPDPWRALPAGLRARSRPPVETPVGALRALDLVWLLACSGAVFGLRRRPLLALCLGLVGAAGAIGLRRFVPPTVGAGVTVIEADLTAAAALRVDAAAGSLRLPSEDTPLEVTTRPRGARLDWTLELSDGGGASSVCEVAGSVCVVSSLPVGPGLALAPDGNGWSHFAEVWTRSAAGEWAAHGPWLMGGALPQALAEGDMPPGWLASGLPPGRGVLIGRLTLDPASGRGGSPLGPGASVWLRATGFE